MRNLIILLALSAQLLVAATDWSQPPVECLEESVPQPPRRTCPDLTKVTSPSSGWPAGMTAAEKKLWTTTYVKDMRICRAQEIIRRETLKPGTFSAATVEYAWMRVDSAKSSVTKRLSVGKASTESKMPQSILVGAILQESYFANLGISLDGGNYSCGMAQLNPQEWCNWMESLSATEQATAKWPTATLTAWKNANPGKNFCGSYLSLSMMDPFYRRAKAKLGTQPLYRLSKTHFQNLSKADILKEFPAAPAATQEARYAALKGFIDNCNNVEYAIRGKAFTIGKIFTRYVPKKLQAVQKYPTGKTYSRKCGYSWKSPYYPAHPGWLLAVGIYNVGPRAAEMAQYYQQWTTDQFQNSEFWTTSKPQDIVEMLYWSGKYNRVTDQIDYKSPGGTWREIAWYRQCIVQRHVANTLQNVAIPGNTLVAAESPAGCPKSIFDTSGNLIETKVPADRRASSGVRN